MRTSQGATNGLAMHRRTKLDTVIMVYASEEEAVASFPKQ
jgi:hypothetical protein